MEMVDGLAGKDRRNWRRESTGEYVCSICEQRSKREQGSLVSVVREFRTDSAVQLREHFRGHRDNPRQLHGDLLPVTHAPLDELDVGELAELDAMAIEQLSL